MPINILMPALSPTMEKGNLAKWHVKEGDQVKSGDVIAEIETDKATMEVEAVDEGRVGKILIAEGAADVPVNAPIAVLLEEGEDSSAIQAAASAPPAAPSPAPAKSEEAPVAPQQQAPRPNGAAAAAAQAANGQAVAERGDRVFASPLARRIAKEAGIDLNAVKGSGPHGRIVKRDVEAAQAGGVPQAPRPAAEAPRPAMAPTFTDQQIRGMFEPDSFEEKPHDGMRRTIARRLTEAKQTIPHFYVTMDVELDALLALRRQMNDAAPKEGPGAYKLSVNDFVIKAMAMALQKVPMANATWTENARLLHKHSDVGVAVAVPDGLFTPIIRKADLKTLSQISNEMKDLASRARSKRLKPEEYQGGTTAVSNLGMYGVKDFAAVINPPHGTILAVGAGEERMVVKKGQPAVATVMSCTLSCDHRAVDGALGAELLAAFRNFIERPVSMFV